MSVDFSRTVASPNYLIITSSAGGGLLQSAIAQEQSLKLIHPDVKIVKKDVLRDWVWKWLGRFSIESWNLAQKKGSVRQQQFFASNQRLFEFISWPNIFLNTLFTLFKEDIDRVIDTQPNSTSAIVKAIRIYNWRKKKSVVLEKLPIDLPTKKATHFFSPIKFLSPKDKKFIKLRSITPLLEDGQTNADFWQKHCGISESQVQYEDVNVRQPFKALKGIPRPDTDINISFRYKNSEELKLMRNSYERGNIKADIDVDMVTFTIPKNAKVVTILLGSQPASSATVNYVLEFIKIAKKISNTQDPIFLFVFCADHVPNTSSLFRKVADAVMGCVDYPQNLSVIPFSFQSDHVVAPLFHRSSITCSRSGGGTATELMAVSTGEIWIHSETKKKSSELTLQELLQGIPVWESESALYLVKLNNAKIMTPETFSARAMEILES